MSKIQPREFSIICFVMGGFFFVISLMPLMVSIFAFGLDTSSDIIVAIVLPLIFVLFGIGFIIAGIVLRKKLKNTVIPISSKQPINTPYESPNESSQSLKKVESSEELYSTDHKVDWRKIEPLIYTGDINDEKCPVCKLSLNSSDTLLSCPNCIAIFHHEHFVDWILSHQTCPVCFTKIDL